MPFELIRKVGLKYRFTGDVHRVNSSEMDIQKVTQTKINKYSREPKYLLQNKL